MGIIVAGIGCAAPADAPVRYALVFDGHDSYVTVPSFRYDGSHPITVEAIASHDMEDGEAGVVADTEFAGVAIDFTDGYWQFIVWNGRTYIRAEADEPSLPNQRVHVAGVFDGRGVSLYLDGKAQGAALRIDGRFKPSQMPLVIGASPGGTDGDGCIDHPFTGVIEAVRLSRTVRYRRDFEPPLRLSPDEDTILLLRFDEGKGPLAHDASGHEHHGLIHGAKWVKIADDG